MLAPKITIIDLSSPAARRCRFPRIFPLLFLPLSAHPHPLLSALTFSLIIVRPGSPRHTNLKSTASTRHPWS